MNYETEDKVESLLYSWAQEFDGMDKVRANQMVFITDLAHNNWFEGSYTGLDDYKGRINGVHSDIVSEKFDEVVREGRSTWDTTHKEGVPLIQLEEAQKPENYDGKASRMVGRISAPGVEELDTPSITNIVREYDIWEGIDYNEGQSIEELVENIQ